MSNKALLSNTELELTQRLQMMFPRGAIPAVALQYWNGRTREEWEKEITPKLIEILFHLPKDVQDSVLRRLYANKVLMVDGRKVAVYKLVKRADFQMMYGTIGDLEHLWITTAQKDTFCKVHRDKLSGRGQTFFLCKNDESKSATPDNLDVHSVFEDSRGLLVKVNLFTYGFMWGAHLDIRLVVSELSTK